MICIKKICEYDDFIHGIAQSNVIYARAFFHKTNKQGFATERVSENKRVCKQRKKNTLSEMKSFYNVQT